MSRHSLRKLAAPSSSSSSSASTYDFDRCSNKPLTRESGTRLFRATTNDLVLLKRKIASDILIHRRSAEKRIDCYFALFLFLNRLTNTAELRFRKSEFFYFIKKPDDIITRGRSVDKHIDGYFARFYFYPDYSMQPRDGVFLKSWYTNETASLAPEKHTIYNV